MKDIIELPYTKNGNTLYIITYCADGVCGMDYTENLAELLDLMVFHSKNSDTHDVYKLRGVDNV